MTHTTRGMAVDEQRHEAPGGGALAGVKVVELAHVIAGPLAGTLLADLGADVVHVEAPGSGDTARTQGPAKDGVHLWWKVSGRNKRSVTIDLRRPEGQALAHELVAWADVVITNMRASTLEKWGLDWASLHELHPRLVMLQISGNGASTSARNEPGFGKVGEARSAVHTGFSHGDSVTALMGAFGICAALVGRQDPDFTGEWIDLALFESLYRLVEWQIIVADQLGVVPNRSGNQLAVAPAAVVNTYLSADGVWITVTSGTPRSVRNIAEMLGEPGEDYRTVGQQAERKDRLDTLLRAWIEARPAEASLREMSLREVTASRVYTAADILADPIYAERDDIVAVPDPELGSVRMQAVVPRLTQRPGSVWRTGAALGEDNELVFSEWLGRSPDELAALRSDGVI
jgi:crotonobetainyl-CoA:carnitine CoA-transferase CaiB-like acyl-CoA transferase